MNILVRLSIGAFAVALASTAAADSYPDRPIRLIVSTTAGSVPDIVARLIGDRLSGGLGQPVVIDNRPGAGGAIGLSAVARAKPDGYTLGLLALPYVLAPLIAGNATYRTERDLAPVALINWNYAILVVRSNSRIHSVDDLVAAARAAPGSIKYSSQGIATPGHIAMALLAHHAHVDMLHVPYKGAPAAVTALLAGDVDALAAGLGSAGPHLASGELRSLATLSPQRLPSHPELPTMAELGYPGVELTDFQGIVAPAGTPQEIVSRLADEVARIVAMPDMRARLEAIGMRSSGLGSDAFAAIIRDEVRRWTPLVAALQLKTE